MTGSTERAAHPPTDADPPATAHLPAEADPPSTAHLPTDADPPSTAHLPAESAAPAAVPPVAAAAPAPPSDPTPPPDPAVAAARARWRAAEDRLYPTLLAVPHAYQRGLAAVHAILDELRHDDADLPALLAADAAPYELVAAACPNGSSVPAELLVGVACGLRDRELRARADARRREEAVRTARAAGAEWAVLDGPADPAELDAAVGGRRLAVHLATGTLLDAVADPWSRETPFSVTVSPGPTHTFTVRADWLAALASLTAEPPTPE